MKTLLTIVLGLGFNSCLFAQGQAAQTVSAPSDSSTATPFRIVDEMPAFPGGMRGLSRFISRNLKYPEAARNAGVSGTVRVSFVITPSGKIENPTVLEGVGYGCDEEAIRVVNAMPLWTPGKQDGQPVSVRYSVPFQFKIN